MSTFIGTDDLAAYLDDDTITDASLRALIAVNTACQIVVEYLDKPLLLEMDVEGVLDGAGSDALKLPGFPIRDVTKVVENGVELLTDGSDWFLRGRVLYRVGCRWPVGRGNVVVTYDRGYDLGGGPYPGAGELLVPDSVRGVALSLAARIYSSGTVGQGGVTEEQIGDYRYVISAANRTAAFALEEAEKVTLAHEREVGVK